MFYGSYMMVDSRIMDCTIKSVLTFVFCWKQSPDLNRRQYRKWREYTGLDAIACSAGHGERLIERAKLVQKSPYGDEDSFRATHGKKENLS